MGFIVHEVNLTVRMKLWHGNSTKVETSGLLSMMIWPFPHASLWIWSGVSEVLTAVLFLFQKVTQINSFLKTCPSLITREKSWNMHQAIQLKELPIQQVRCSANKWLSVKVLSETKTIMAMSRFTLTVNSYESLPHQYERCMRTKRSWSQYFHHSCSSPDNGSGRQHYFDYKLWMTVRNKSEK